MDDIRGNTEVEHTGPLAGEQAGSSGATEHTEVQAAALGATTSTILPIVNTLPDDVHVGDLDGSIPLPYRLATEGHVNARPRDQSESWQRKNGEIFVDTVYGRPNGLAFI